MLRLQSLRIINLFSSFSVSQKVEVGGTRSFFLKVKGFLYSTVVVSYGLFNWFLLVKIRTL